MYHYPGCHFLLLCTSCYASSARRPLPRYLQVVLCIVSQNCRPCYVSLARSPLPTYLQVVLCTASQTLCRVMYRQSGLHILLICRSYYITLARIPYLTYQQVVLCSLHYFVTSIMIIGLLPVFQRTSWNNYPTWNFFCSRSKFIHCRLICLENAY